MDRITGTYLPAGLTTEEKQLVFSYCALKSSLYGSPSTNQFPHFYTEGENSYTSPVLSDRIVFTPEHGLRMVITMSIPIHSMYAFNASGLWNHILPMAGNLVLPE